MLYRMDNGEGTFGFKFFLLRCEGTCLKRSIAFNSQVLEQKYYWTIFQRPYCPSSHPFDCDNWWQIGWIQMISCLEQGISAFPITTSLNLKHPDVLEQHIIMC